MSKVIAVTNHKGGVGKTTSVASIGAILARKGKRTLLVDLDAQANLTTSLCQTEPELSIYHALKGETKLPVTNLRERLDIVCSSLDMAGAELELSPRMRREYILKDLLKPVLEDYDYILLDCPPSLGLVTINALVAATEIYIPLTAEALPSKGLKMLSNILEIVKDLNNSLDVTGVIITRWEEQKLSRMVEQRLRADFGDRVFKTKIRKNVAIAEAPLAFTDVAEYAPESNGAKDYESLTEEILKRK